MALNRCHFGASSEFREVNLRSRHGATVTSTMKVVDDGGRVMAQEYRRVGIG